MAGAKPDPMESAIATFVERHSRFVILVALPNGHTADVVADALAAKITELPSAVATALWLLRLRRLRHGVRVAVHDLPLPVLTPVDLRHPKGVLPWCSVD
jgi:hypothetical protein